jgi:hypothetical protein
MLKGLLTVLALLTINTAHTQNGFANKKPLVLGLNLQYGNIYAHTKPVQNVANAKPSGIELEFSHQKIDDSTWNMCNCYPRSGIATSYFDFHNSILGKSGIVAYFLEPTYRVGNRFQLYIRGTVGVSYLSNPYNPVKAPDNRSYGLYFNPYLHVGAGLGCRVNKHVVVRLMGNFHHISNGGNKEPNRGVNWLTGSVGVLYTPADNTLPKFERKRSDFWKGKKGLVDVGVMAAPAQGYSSYLEGTRQNLFGVFGQYTKQIGRTSALTGGVEVYYSEIDEAVTTIEKGSASHLFAGVHAGHAFLLGRVTFKQQLGVYIFNQTNYFTDVYLRWGLDYKLSKHFLVGVNLKAHTDNADFVDGRVMYRF